MPWQQDPFYPSSRSNSCGTMPRHRMIPCAKKPKSLSPKTLATIVFLAGGGAMITITHCRYGMNTGSFGRDGPKPRLLDCSPQGSPACLSDYGGRMTRWRERVDTRCAFVQILRGQSSPRGIELAPVSQASCRWSVRLDGFTASLD